MMEERIRISENHSEYNTSDRSGDHRMVIPQQQVKHQPQQQQQQSVTTASATTTNGVNPIAQHPPPFGMVGMSSSEVNARSNHCCSDPYITADTYRICAAAAAQQHQHVGEESNRVYYVNDRPYIPQWRVEVVKDVASSTNDDNGKHNRNNDVDRYLSIKSVAAAIMLLVHQPSTTTSDETTVHNMTSNCTSVTIPDATIIQSITKYLSVERVIGGVTNTLYKVSGFHQSSQYGIIVDTVLVRIFGAEGLIDRDDETGVFAALSQCHLAPSYYGRFNNGRVEGYEDGMRPLQYQELRTGPTSITKGIAINLARLHYGFRILPILSIERSKPTLWKQLYGWLDQAEAAMFEFESDRKIVQTLQLSTIRPELLWLQEAIETVIDRNTDPIVFCHNDLLAANILYNDTTEIIRLIDFEYGGINYRAFDIANHFNEYAGGPPTEIYPNYNLLPTEEQQRYFIRTYLETAAATTSLPSSSTCDTVLQSNTPTMNGSSMHSVVQKHEEGEDIVGISDIPVTDQWQVDAMMKEVEIFLLANHLYWGLWGINQASIEGCSVYDYMTYGSNRIQQYWIQRNKIR